MVRNRIKGGDLTFEIVYELPKNIDVSSAELTYDDENVSMKKDDNLNAGD